MTLGRIALARIPAIRCKIHNVFSAPHSSSSTNRTSPPLSRHMSMKSENLVSKLTSSGLLKTQGLIDGKWVDAHDGDTMKVLNPATGEVVAIVPCMGQSETNNAISSAYDAFRSWSKLTASERSQHIRKWYDLLIAHKEELGQLITLEQGKPLKEAMGEVSYGASFIEFYAEEAKRVYGDIIPATLGDRRLFVLKQPVGVVGAITPWNFPLAMITRKVGPALACGCTVVLKPSELTPLTALAAAELALQAGIPPGVLNVVMGKAPDIGDALLASHEVRKITFTGSTAVGKKLMAGAAETVKRLAAKFCNSGQTCVCANRIIERVSLTNLQMLFQRLFRVCKLEMDFSEGVAQIGGECALTSQTGGLDF